MELQAADSEFKKALESEYLRYFGRRVATRYVSQRLGWSHIPTWTPEQQNASATVDYVKENEALQKFAKDVLVHCEAFPFIHILLPFLFSEAYGLLRRYPEPLHGLITQFAPYGLARLGKVAARALYLEFDIYRKVRAGHPQSFQSTTDGYSDFCTRVLEEECTSIFIQYPVLAKLVKNIATDWGRFAEEFIENFIADRSAIEVEFEIPEKTNVHHTTVGLSDPHKGGTTVVLLEFETGQQLIYKPNPGCAQNLWNDYLVELSHQLPKPASSVINCISRKNYHWCEVVRKSPPSSFEERTDLARNAGIALSAAFILGASDIHFENTIVANDKFFVVDLETLLQPLLGVSRHSLLASNLTNLADTVLRTGMLPGFEYFGEDYCVDISPFTGGAELGSAPPSAVWENVNSDSMSLTYTPKGTLQESKKNSPNESWWDHQLLPHLIEGFVWGCEAASASKNALRTLILNYAEDVRPRFIFRSTNTYSRLMDSLRRPDLLTSLHKWLAFCDARLSDCMVPSEECPLEMPLLMTEILALQRFDVPTFTVRATDMRLSYPSTAPLFEVSGVELALARLDQLGPARITWEAGMIEAAFGYVAAASHPPRDIYTLRKISHVSNRQILSDDELIKEASTIGKELCEKALTTTAGGATWLGHSALNRPPYLEFGPIGSGFYKGTAGIAIFLASLYEMTRENAWKDLAVRCLTEVIAVSSNRELGPRLLSKLGSGLGRGISGLVYTLLQTGHLLNDPALIDHGFELTEKYLLEPDCCDESDTPSDLLEGALGVANLMLFIFEQFGNARYLGVAKNILVACSRSETDSYNQKRVGPPPEIVNLGLAHGIGGWLFTITRYNMASYDDPLKMDTSHDWSNLLIRIENHRDLGESETSDVQAHSVGHWCSGMAGVLLGYLYLRRNSGATIPFSNIPTDEYLTRRIEEYAKAVFSYTDQMCCGTAAIMELLIEASLDNSISTTNNAPKMLASAMHELKHENGCYRVFESSLNAFPNLSLFRGKAGIGLSLLRIINPQLPAPLVLG